MIDMLSALPACPMRLSVRVIPITAKPARVRMFMPKRMSLAKVRRLSGGGNGIRTTGPAPAQGSSGRCQLETAARKAEPLTGSGPRRRCLPGVAPHRLSLRGGTESSNPSSSSGESSNYRFCCGGARFWRAVKTAAPAPLRSRVRSRRPAAEGPAARGDGPGVLCRRHHRDRLPGRFAAAINQPPLLSYGAILPVDWRGGEAGERCWIVDPIDGRSEEHTSELQSQFHLVCRLLLEK